MADSIILYSRVYLIDLIGNLYVLVKDPSIATYEAKDYHQPSTRC